MRFRGSPGFWRHCVFGFGCVVVAHGFLLYRDPAGVSIQAPESLANIRHLIFHDASISITHPKPSRGSHNHQHRRASEAWATGCLARHYLLSTCPFSASRFSPNTSPSGFPATFSLATPWTYLDKLPVVLTTRYPVSAVSPSERIYLNQ